MPILRAIIRVIVTIGVVFYVILDELLFPLFRPLVRWLSALRLFESLGALIQRLPPYAVLVLLAVPFILIEPAKVVALLWIAEGRIITGILLLVAAQIISIFTCDRIYHVGHAQLMQIGWFKTLMTWLKSLRDWALNWAKSTAAWQWTKRTISQIRAWFAGLIAGAK